MPLPRILPTTFAALLAVVASTALASADSSLFDAAFRSYPLGGGSSVSVGDIDKDGHLDLAVAQGTLGVALLRGQGDGAFAAWKALTIYDASSVVLSDVNQDGNLDLVVCHDNAVSVSFGRGDGRFGNTVEMTTRPNAASVQIADVNRDGILDLVVSDSDPFYGYAISTFLGLGNNTFGPQEVSIFYPGVGLYTVALGDLNGDGIPDLAVGPNGTSASVMLGHGDGTFANAGYFTTWGQPSSLILADVNGDGKLDLITSGSIANLLLGKGDGTFDAATQLGPGGGAALVTDLNHDGKLDAVFLDGSTIHVALGNGNGTFQPMTSYDTGYSSAGVAAGDFNGDGTLDLVTVSGYAGTISVSAGNGDGSFGKGEKYAAGHFPAAAASGDFDGDGTLDLAVANAGDDTPEFSLYRGRGDGSFTPVAAPFSDPSYLVLSADLNHDGKDDLVISHPGFEVFLATGAMDFGPATAYVDSLTFQSLAVGDLNGDGIPDLAGTLPYRFNGDIHHPAWTPRTEVYLTFGRGDGTFAGDTVLTGLSSPTDLAISDFDLNGHNDLLVANGSSSTISVFLADASGKLQAPVSYPTLAPSALVVADLDGNGVPDVGILSGSTVAILRGLGGGQLGPPEEVGAVSNANALAAADLDLDGRVDLVVSATYANGPVILRGLGNGAFDAGEWYGTNAGPGRVAIRDFNGDGRPDMAVPNAYDRSVSILRNRTTAVSVPGLVFLENVIASPTMVQLSWRSETIPASQTRVDRSTDGKSWTTLGQPGQVGADQITFDDRSVGEGESYQYRLMENGSTVLSVTSVQVPFVQALALEVTPNPIHSDGHLAFHLASPEKGSLEIWSAAGRRVWSEEVGALGAGEHTIDFPRSAALRSGSYFLRLSQGQRSVVQRFTVLR